MTIKHNPDPATDTHNGTLNPRHDGLAAKVADADAAIDAKAMGRMAADMANVEAADKPVTRADLDAINKRIDEIQDSLNKRVDTLGKVVDIHGERLNGAGDDFRKLARRVDRLKVIDPGHA